MHVLKVHKGHKHKEYQVPAILCDGSLDEFLGISLLSKDNTENITITPEKQDKKSTT